MPKEKSQESENVVESESFKQALSSAIKKKQDEKKQIEPSEPLKKDEVEADKSETEEIPKEVEKQS